MLLSGSVASGFRFAYGIIKQLPHFLADMPGATHNDTAKDPRSMPYRGNVTRTSTPGGARCAAYNRGGMALQSWDGYGHSSTVTPDEQKNDAVPKAMTTGSYTSTAIFWRFRRSRTSFRRQVEHDSGLKPNIDRSEATLEY